MTESRIEIRATNPTLNPFLIRYYTLAISTINQLEAQDSRIRNPMLLVFNTMYLNFMTQYGVPMSCVSFYTGQSEFTSVSQVRQLSGKLHKRFGLETSTGGNQQVQAHHSGSSTNANHFGVLGKDLGNKLKLRSGPFSVTIPSLEPGTQAYNIMCETIFLTRKELKSFGLIN